jgi:predicted lipoprotein with Yx(FWY)xxD motif
MKHPLGLAMGAAAVALAAAACSSSSPSTSSAPASTGAPASTAAASTISVENTSSGKILVDGQGRTLYLFAADTGKTSTCTGACAAAWPPLTTTGTPTAGAGLTASLLGTTKRSDGTTEITYGGHPLYYFEGDSATGDISGQNVTAFGAKWYVVSPSGSAVTAATVTGSSAGPSSSPSSSPTSGGGNGY